MLLDVAEESDLGDRSNLLAFAARSLTFVVPKPDVVRRVVTAVVTVFLDMPDAAGHPQIRYLLGLGDLEHYDDAFFDLRETDGELRRDVGIAVAESLAAALDNDPPSENVLLVCHRSEDFLGTTSLPEVRESEELLALRYQARLAERPFLMHDVQRVLQDTLSIRELFDRYGPDGLYPMPLIPQGNAAWTWESSIYGVVARHSRPQAERIAGELLRYLPSCPAPWVGNKAVFATYESYPLRSHGEADIVADGEYFAGVLLLALPHIEYSAGISGPMQFPTVLGDVASLCASARQGQVAEHAIRDALATREVPAEVADFVVRWANNEFSLVAGP